MQFSKNIHSVTSSSSSDGALRLPFARGCAGARMAAETETADVDGREVAVNDEGGRNVLR